MYYSANPIYQSKSLYSTGFTPSAFYEDLTQKGHYKIKTGLTCNPWLGC